jgi:hypothetical protein
MLPDYVGGGMQKDYYGRDEVVDVPCPSCGATAGATLAAENGSVGVRRCAGCELI